MDSPWNLPHPSVEGKRPAGSRAIGCLEALLARANFPKPVKIQFVTG